MVRVEFLCGGGAKSAEERLSTKVGGPSSHLPGKQVACDYGLLSTNYRLLWGIVAFVVEFPLVLGNLAFLAEVAAN